MAWPTSRAEFLQKIKELEKENLQEEIRPEVKIRNIGLIEAFKQEVKDLDNEGE